MCNTEIDQLIAGAHPEELGKLGFYCMNLTAAQLDACIKGADLDGFWRGMIGCYRMDLTESQLDACIKGTDARWRSWIGRNRTDLTEAQRRMCRE